MVVLQGKTKHRLVRTLIAAALVTGVAGQAAQAQSLSCAAGETEFLFSATGNVQTFTVPADLQSARIIAAGGQGGTIVGNPNAARGGFGGVMTAQFDVTPGQTFSIIVGEQPTGPIPPNSHAGGGGTFIGSPGFVHNSDGNTQLYLVAGGGGGGTSALSGGNGGAPGAGQDGESNTGTVGTGGHADGSPHPENIGSAGGGGALFGANGHDDPQAGGGACGGGGAGGNGGGIFTFGGGGQSAMNGGAGGVSSDPAQRAIGGFGGGGCGGISGSGTAGAGGGGFAGGAGGIVFGDGGGGGSSYMRVGGTLLNASATNQGNGFARFCLTQAAPSPTGGGPQSVPTLSNLGLIAMLGLVFGIGAMRLQRRN
jgi:hypothetical protein